MNALTSTPSVTGIPIEYLFTIIGAFGTIIFGFVMRELRQQRRSSDARAASLAYLERYIIKICDKLEIDYRPRHDQGDL